MMMSHENLHSQAFIDTSTGGLWVSGFLEHFYLGFSVRTYFL